MFTPSTFNRVKTSKCAEAQITLFPINPLGIYLVPCSLVLLQLSNITNNADLSLSSWTLRTQLHLNLLSFFPAERMQTVVFFIYLPLFKYCYLSSHISSGDFFPQSATVCKLIYNLILPQEKKSFWIPELENKCQHLRNWIWKFTLHCRAYKEEQQLQQKRYCMSWV